MRTLKSLEIKFHIEKLAVNKKNICPCLSLSERSLQPLLFSSFNSFFPSAALSPMQCSHALQTLEGVCCQIWVPRVHISGFPSSAKDSGFFAFPTAAAGAQCGAFLGLGLCPGAVGSPGAAGPGQLVPGVSQSQPQPWTQLPSQHCTRLCRCLVPGLRSCPQLFRGNHRAVCWAPGAGLPCQPLQEHPCCPARASPGGFHWRSALLSWLYRTY